MKAIMISDKPKWCALMMNGKKNIEVRKNKALASAIQKLIDIYGYADIYVYCSKDQELFYKLKHNERYYFVANNRKNFYRLSNGLVVFKFRCYKVEEHKDFDCMFPYSKLRYNKATCLDQEEIEDYGFIEGKGYVPLYAIHISDVEIFDIPKKLSEFKQPRDSYGKVNWHTNEYYYMELTKAPQNFCYVEVDE